MTEFNGTSVREAIIPAGACAALLHMASGFLCVLAEDRGSQVKISDFAVFEEVGQNSETGS